MCNEVACRIALGQLREDWSQLKVPLTFPEGLPNLAPLDSIRITDSTLILRTAQRTPTSLNRWRVGPARYCPPGPSSWRGLWAMAANHHDQPFDRARPQTGAVPLVLPLTASCAQLLVSYLSDTQATEQGDGEGRQEEG